MPAHLSRGWVWEGAVEAPSQIIPAAELKKRLRAWKAPKPRYTRGVMAKYARLVSLASEGAVTG